MSVQFKHEHVNNYGKVDTKISYISNAEDLSDVVQDFRNFLLALGYQPESIAKYIEVI